jgi:serralysin
MLLPTSQPISSGLTKDISAFPAGEDTASIFLSNQINEAGDAAAGLGTTATMAIGDLFDGTISGAGDNDWIRVSLTAGQAYVFSVWGTGGSNLGLQDTIMNLYNGGGSLIATNDDVEPGSNLFSAIEFTATTTGTYYIGISGYDASNVGKYTVQAATNIYTVDQVVTQLTEFGWGITTAISHDENTGDVMDVNISALTAAGQQLALWALDAWSTVLGITFQTTLSSTADIIFDDSQSGAFAGPSSYFPSTGQIVEATVNVGTSWLNTYGTTYDSYSYLTYLHEIGHALGLSHSGPYDGSASFPSSALFLNDSTLMTLMSYFDNSDNTYISGTNTTPVTPMIADIAAVNSLYGVPSSVYGGNTTWGANSNVGGNLGQLFGIIFDGDPSNPAFYSGRPVSWTVYDTNGIDTIDMSTVSANQAIDLRSEAVSDVGGYQANMVIAVGTVIENAISGSGNDLLTGNSADNSLTGNLGNDTLSGADGNDWLDGGDGFDTIYGGAGNDQILGRVGNDLLFGDDGHDNISASSGRDTVYGGMGNDQIGGGNGDDLLYGEDGNDIIGSGNDSDTIDGGDGNDVASGGYGADSVIGGLGDDTLAGSFGDDIVLGGAGHDSLGGGFGRDTIYGGAGNDLIGAGEQEDLIHGDDGNDFLAGADGNDQLFGGNDNDTLNGGLGNDTLDGGLGVDIFVFNALTNGEIDTITDFENGTDFIRMHGVAGTGQAGKFASLSVTGVTGGVEISYGGHVIVVDGVTVGNIDQGDFIFV